jgi:hypothetical protein
LREGQIEAKFDASARTLSDIMKKEMSKDKVVLKQEGNMPENFGEDKKYDDESSHESILDDNEDSDDMLLKLCAGGKSRSAHKQPAKGSKVASAKQKPSKVSHTKVKATSNKPTKATKASSPAGRSDSSYDPQLYIMSNGGSAVSEAWEVALASLSSDADLGNPSLDAVQFAERMKVFKDTFNGLNAELTALYWRLKKRTSTPAGCFIILDEERHQYSTMSSLISLFAARNVDELLAIDKAGKLFDTLSETVSKAMPVRVTLCYYRCSVPAFVVVVVVDRASLNDIGKVCSC